MNSKPLPQTDLPKNFTGGGRAIRNQVRARAREIARVNGRAWREASESDFAQARQELAGIDSKTAIRDAAPESERLDSLPGSAGHQASTNAGADEVDGGRSELVDNGVARAEFNQMFQASRVRQNNH